MNRLDSAVAAKFLTSYWPAPESVRQELVSTAARMEGMINLSIGDPDLPTPPNVVEAGIAALRRGLTHYTPNAGIPELRRAIAGRLQRDYGLEVDGDREVAVTHGCAEALFVALQSLLDPGDEVILGDPFYPGHVTAIVASGGKPVLVPTDPADGFLLSAREIAGRISPRTKVLLLVSPHNPCGAVLSGARLDEIAELARSRDLIVISDEVYERMVFDGVPHTPVATLPGMRERTVTVSSFSKTYCMAGWRVGYMVAPGSLMPYMIQVRRSATICTSGAAQHAALEALQPSTEPHLRLILETYARRRQMFMAGLDRLGIGYVRPAGTFFLMMDIRPSGLTSVQAARRLLHDGRVLVWPGTMFGKMGEGYLRISLTQDVAALAEVLQRLGRVFRQS